MEFESRERTPLQPITQRLIDSTERLTGREIRLVTEAVVGGQARATYQASRSDEHTDIIAVVPGESHNLDHLIGHELGHIRHFESVPFEERRLPVITEAMIRTFADSLRDDPVARSTSSLSPSLLQSMLGQWVGGLTAQLANTPADLEIERNLNRLPEMAPLQERSLSGQVRKEHKVLRPQVQQSTPATVWRASAAMGYTLHATIAEMFNAPWMLTPYRSQPGLVRLGKQLLEVHRELAPTDLDGFYAVSQRWNAILELSPLLNLRNLSELRRR